MVPSLLLNFQNLLKMKKSKFNTLFESYRSKLLSEADVTKKTPEEEEQDANVAEIPQEFPNSSGGSALPSAEVGADGETTVEEPVGGTEAQPEPEQPEAEPEVSDEETAEPAPLSIQDVELMVACLKFGQDNIKIEAKDLAIFDKPITPKNKDMIVQRIRSLVEQQTDVSAI